MCQVGGGRARGSFVKAEYWQKGGTAHSEEVMRTPTPPVLHLPFALSVFSAFILIDIRLSLAIPGKS